MTTKIALVTGGARGISAAIAVRLSAEGYGVVVADRLGGTLPAGARMVACDVSDETEVGGLIGDITAAEGRLDAWSAMPAS